MKIRDTKGTACGMRRYKYEKADKNRTDDYDAGTVLDGLRLG